VGVIFNTQRHLAKSAPSFLYWAQRSYSPSSPVQEAERTPRVSPRRLSTDAHPLICSSLTLGGCLAVGSGQGDDTFVDLDAHHHVSSLEVLGEDHSVVGLLVHGLMEEDDATNARVDAVIGGEEELAVQPPVLLSILSIDALEALGHAA